MRRTLSPLALRYVQSHSAPIDVAIRHHNQANADMLRAVVKRMAANCILPPVDVKVRFRPLRWREVKGHMAPRSA